MKQEEESIEKPTEEDKEYFLPDGREICDIMI